MTAPRVTPKDHLIYATEAEAAAGAGRLTERGVSLAAAFGYRVEPGGLVGKAAAIDRPGATRTVDWCPPRRRLDGAWTIIHPRHHPAADTVIPGAGRTHCELAIEGISAPVETESRDRGLPRNRRGPPTH